MVDLRTTGGFLLPLTKLPFLELHHIRTPVGREPKSSPKAGCKVTGFVGKHVDSLQLAI